MSAIGTNSEAYSDDREQEVVADFSVRSPDFPLTSPSLHTTSFSPHKSPVSSAHCLKGPTCHRGGEGAVGSREQDDERLDEVWIGWGCGADGELLGRQRAGGGDRAQAGKRPGVCGGGQLLRQRELHGLFRGQRGDCGGGDLDAGYRPRAAQADQTGQQQAGAGGDQHQLPHRSGGW